MAAAFSFLAKEFIGAEPQMRVGFPVCAWVLWKIPGFAENSDFLVYKPCLAVWSYFMAFCPWDSIANLWSSACDAAAKFKRRVLLVWVLKGIFSTESWRVGHKALWSMVNLALLIWDWKFILYRFFFFLQRQQWFWVCFVLLPQPLFIYSYLPLSKRIKN